MSTDRAVRARARKLADRIRVVVAETLETRVKDPRLGFITVTDARVTGDLREATVFYTVYGDDTERAATAAALESAKGVLRTEVGRQTGVRHTPSLTFIADAVPETAKHIEDLLVKAAAADAEVHRVAAEAEYAGEPDPYRAPGDEDGADGEHSAGGAAGRQPDGPSPDTPTPHRPHPDGTAGDGAR